MYMQITPLYKSILKCYLLNTDHKYLFRLSVATLNSIQGFTITHLTLFLHWIFLKFLSNCYSQAKLWVASQEGNSTLRALHWCCLIAQLCPTLCNPMDCSPPGSPVHGDSPGKNTGVDCHSLLQRIFLTQGYNPGLLHCRQILYRLSYREVHVYMYLLF